MVLRFVQYLLCVYLVVVLPCSINHGVQWATTGTTGSTAAGSEIDSTTGSTIDRDDDDDDYYYNNVEMIVMDSVQINPGDYGQGQQQGTKYSDPYFLKQMGYKARSTSMEQNPALCISYKNADRTPANGVWTSDDAIDRNAIAWVKAYCQSLQRLLNETIQAGLELFFFTDMIVFPTKLFDYYPEVVCTNNMTSKVSILYNNYTEYLLSILFEEWMELFPLTSGIIVRTGETYTFDTPYHSGSSPIDSITDQIEQNNVWVQYVQLLRQSVCVQYKKKVIFRTWFSITDVVSYEHITQQIPLHPLLYFSVKHTQGDFFRQMSMNHLLNIGTHPQIIEVQIQREYEGKGSYPIYLFEHIVLYDPSSGSNRSLSDIFLRCNNTSMSTNTSSSPLLVKGLWTWSRGGGWWGPYIHNNEFWIDLNMNMFLSWWNDWNCTVTSETVIQLFQNACYQTIFNHYMYRTNNVDPMATTQSQLLIDACTDLREALLLSDTALLYGRYCLEVPGPYGNCWIWTRDDRIGGINQLQAHMDTIMGNDTLIDESLWYKEQSLLLWEQAMKLYDSNVSSAFQQINPRIDWEIRSSFLYAQSYYCIIEAAWRALVYGKVRYDATNTNHTLLHVAISDYDACWNMYHAIGLATPEFPSYYKGIYWNFPFEPENEGMDASIDDLRYLLTDTISSTNKQETMINLE